LGKLFDEIYPRTLAVEGVSEHCLAHSLGVDPSWHALDGSFLRVSQPDLGVISPRYALGGVVVAAHLVAVPLGELLTLHLTIVEATEASELVLLRHYDYVSVLIHKVRLDHGAGDLAALTSVYRAGL